MQRMQHTPSGSCSVPALALFLTPRMTSHRMKASSANRTGKTQFDTVRSHPESQEFSFRKQKTLQRRFL